MAEYVDKNDVYRAARESLCGEGLMGIVAASIFETAVKKLPAEEMEEVRHAEWEDDRDGRSVCTHCRSVVRERYRYCPWCGARMRC